MNNNMFQMPFPFCLNNMNANGQQNGQTEDGTTSPFGGMPQMPFPFFMPGMNNTANSDQTQQGGFPFGGMPRMPFSFGAAGNKSEDNKMEIPPQVAELLKNVIGALINMESTPEGLEKLQKILDMVFSLIPKKEAEEN